MRLIPLPRFVEATYFDDAPAFNKHIELKLKGFNPAFEDVFSNGFHGLKVKTWVTTRTQEKIVLDILDK